MSDELEVLKARVHNLEVALQGMWALLKDVTPVAYADDIGEVMRKFYNASEGFGAFRSPHFKDNENLRW